MIKLCNLERFTFRVLSGCCLLAATTFTVHAQPLTFTTFAGPSGGAGLADGTGSAARFTLPIAVAADAAGNVYVGDLGNRTIRKISPAGVVTTFAGLATAPPGANDGAGGDARFAAPNGVATDSGGNVYVADRDNNTIRKITPAGVVTTLAGSPGLSGSANGSGGAARFDSPEGVATDSAGNVYVADTQNDTIRKITPAGVVTTLAGSAGFFGDADGTGSAAGFDSPEAVATDSAGNVYVADTQNDTIRKITPAGVVTTFAGSAGIFGDRDGIGNAARFDSPGGVATDSAGNVYVADSGNATIRKITPAGVVTTLAGSSNNPGTEDGAGSTARFYEPFAVATGDGNVYVADSFNHTIRKIASSGVVTTMAGLPALFGSADGTGSAARFFFPSAVATDDARNAYVADLGNSTIRKITPAGVVTTMAGSPGLAGSVDGIRSAARFQLDIPSGITTDGGGNVYVADTGNDTIRKITPVGVVTTFAGSAGLAGADDGAGSGARFDSPRGVAADSIGNIYVVDGNNNAIRKITPAGVVTTLAGEAFHVGNQDGTGSDARFDGPVGVATDGSGNLYVTDSNNATLRKITPAGVVTTLAGSAGLFGSEDGIGSAARFGFGFFSGGPTGVATDRGGNIYVADSANATIRKVTPAGVVTTIASSAGHFGSEDGTDRDARFGVNFLFGGPNGVGTDSDGNVYVADVSNNNIRIGRPALADAATIDFSVGAAGTTRQLNTTPQTATSWQWRIIRQPSGSTATLSSTSIRNPVFMTDVADVYVFRLTASNGVNTRISTVTLTATPAQALPKRRAVGHT